MLYNYFGDRISDVGANEAPDIVEQGRGTLDVVLASGSRSYHPAHPREPDRQRIPVHADADGGENSAAVPSRAGHNGDVRLQRVLRHP